MEKRPSNVTQRRDQGGSGVHPWSTLRGRLLPVAAALAVLGATILTGVAVAGAGTPGAGSEAVLDDRQSLAPAVTPQHDARTGARERDRMALALLRDWNGARAEAWRLGEVEALAALYSRGSVAGARDAERLAEWSAAGWRAQGLAPSVHSVSSFRHNEESWVIDVDETWDAVRAHRDGRAVLLPSGHLRRQRITFRVEEGRWRVLAVEERL